MVVYMLQFIFSVIILSFASSSCPITERTNIIFSTVDGVGGASLIWVEDFLWWWKSVGDPSIEYLGLSASDFQNCDLSQYSNLRVYINPGGDAYTQLSSLGPVGVQNIRRFMERNQSSTPSSYVGFCAGGYIAAHDYLWESEYEGPGFYKYDQNPPLSLFPHTVEGSIVDVGDDQFGDQFGNKFRLVNVSNGQRMLYYGGSTFGYNVAPAYADPNSPEYDSQVEVLLWYKDFYGYLSPNIPAAWKYGPTVLLTSVHPEADNCSTAVDPDCPPEGLIPTEDILQNRAWLSHYINEVARTSFSIPSVPIMPIFDTIPPHSAYPAIDCYKEGQSTPIFCDYFDGVSNATVFPGLSMQFQRNQSRFDGARPWNVSYISTWDSGFNISEDYAVPHSGSGYAFVTPLTAYTNPPATITTKSFSTSRCSASNKVSIAFMVRGYTIAEKGYFMIESSTGSQFYNVDKFSLVASSNISQWEEKTYTVSTTNRMSKSTSMQLRYSCNAGAELPNAALYCAIDSLRVTCV